MIINLVFVFGIMSVIGGVGYGIYKTPNEVLIVVAGKLFAFLFGIVLIIFIYSLMRGDAMQRFIDWTKNIITT